MLYAACGQEKSAYDGQKVHGKVNRDQAQLIYEKSKDLPNGAEIAIAMIRNGKVGYYGITRENDTIVSTNNFRRVFEIGSITKIFTGTLLADFVIEDKINLEDNINQYLDFPLKNGSEVSFLQLATHTSGLPRVPISLNSPDLSLENPYKDFGEEELKAYLSNDLELSEHKGEKSEYSNLGVGLLGYVLGVIGNRTYEELLQTEIFQRYEMINSTTNRQEIINGLVLGLDDTGKTVLNWDMSVLMGAGGILSTTEDLSRFTLAHFNNRNKELKLTRQPFFKIDDKVSMGLAWAIITTEKENQWLWHNGGTGGYTSSIIVNTRAKNGVIILSNISALGKLSANITDLCPEIMNTLE